MGNIQPDTAWKSQEEALCPDQVEFCSLKSVQEASLHHCQILLLLQTSAGALAKRDWPWSATRAGAKGQPRLGPPQCLLLLIGSLNSLASLLPGVSSLWGFVCLFLCFKSCPDLNVNSLPLGNIILRKIAK